MKKVLLAESSLTISLYAETEIARKLNAEVLKAKNFEEVRRHIHNERDNIVLSICDSALGGTRTCEVIDYLIDEKVPVIVFTDTLNDEVRKKFAKKQVIDYILRSSMKNFDLALTLIEQIIRNQETKVMVLDDSATSRAFLKQMLTNLRLQVIEEASPADAIKTLEADSDIKMVITDYKMGEMNGVDFVDKARALFSREELCIIGISMHNIPLLGVEFLKHGANDFLSKPLLKEEFTNKVMLNLDFLRHIETIQSISNTDYMSGLYNRRYIYETGQLLYENAKRGNISLCFAMIDIDHFKRVNDTHGHDIGDKVIIRLAQQLSSHFRNSDLVGRLGGEEFCVFLSNPDIKKVEAIFDRLRRDVEESTLQYTDDEDVTHTVRTTISIGLSLQLQDSFESMIKFADSKLYEAKNYGRNMVVL